MPGDGSPLDTTLPSSPAESSPASCAIVQREQAASGRGRPLLGASPGAPLCSWSCGGVMGGQPAGVFKGTQGHSPGLQGRGSWPQLPTTPPELAGQSPHMCVGVSTRQSLPRTGGTLTRASVCHTRVPIQHSLHCGVSSVHWAALSSPRPPRRQRVKRGWWELVQES